MDDPENPYAPAHRSPSGPNDARPSASQIIKHEGLTGKLCDAVIFITGCSSGLGVETARALSSTGATLFLTARDLSKAREALGSDLAEDPRIHLLKLDLDSLESVRKCAKEFLSQSDKLNILITNAGIRHVPFSKTKDGFEQHFAVNHLAHFLLTNMLLPTLQKSSKFGFQSRVVVLSSTAHRHSSIVFSDVNLEQPGVYSKEKGYAQSKLANVYMASEITRRYGVSASAQVPPRPGVWGLAVHPGGIRTGLQKDSGMWEIVTWYYAKNLMKMLKYMKSPEQGAGTTIVAAVAKRFEGKGALYMEDCGLAVPVRKGWGLIDPGYVPGRTDNEEDAKRLWKVSCQLVAVQDDGL
jgi:NAD(P)-dependent dehydrogenase (short-subunit alcohol dehydrogenase family)